NPLGLLTGDQLRRFSPGRATTFARQRAPSAGRWAFWPCRAWRCLPRRRRTRWSRISSRTSAPSKRPARPSPSPPSSAPSAGSRSSRLRRTTTSRTAATATHGRACWRRRRGAAVWRAPLRGFQRTAPWRRCRSTSSRRSPSRRRGATFGPTPTTRRGSRSSQTRRPRPGPRRIGRRTRPRRRCRGPRAHLQSRRASPTSGRLSTSRVPLNSPTHRGAPARGAPRRRFRTATLWTTWSRTPLRRWRAATSGRRRLTTSSPASTMSARRSATPPPPPGDKVRPRATCVCRASPRDDEKCMYYLIYLTMKINRY
ncbi:hypothetical protein M885DRAFT_89204, partial [Pelagophyceae sp. CCMP2097]